MKALAVGRDEGLEVRRQRGHRPERAARRASAARARPADAPMTLALVLSADAHDAEQLARDVFIEGGQLKWAVAAS